jgi:transcriptional regulator with PAS, ATPase and Fis domain
VAVLKRYDFPGNVRELRNLLERSLLHSSPDSHWLQIDPMWLAQASLRIAEQPAASATPTVQPELPGRGLSALEAQEYELVRQILVAEKGVIRRAAARLGISHQSLLRRLEKWPELRRLIETPRPADGKSEAGTAVAPG